MDFTELIKQNRSYRSFDESVYLSKETLLSFVNCARLSASAANRQPLKYLISYDKETNALIQSTTAWAAKLRPTRILPDPGHYPTAFIVICVDKEIMPDVQKADRDIGIAAQSILLSAVSQGYGGIMIGAFNKNVKELLGLAGRFEPALIIALGKPDEKIVLEDSADGVDYYRDKNDVHHVPKRRMEDILIQRGKTV